MRSKEKTLNKATVSRIVDLIRPYRVTFIIAQVMVMISVALTLYAPVIIGRAIDMIISAGRVDFVALVPQLIKLGIVAAITALAQWLMNVCNNRIAYGAVKDVREQAFTKLQELPLRYIDSKSYGDIISRITTDADQLSDGLIMGFSQLFTGVATILGTLIFMFSVNIIISAAVVVITPLSFFVARFISSHSS